MSLLSRSRLATGTLRSRHQCLHLRPLLPSAASYSTLLSSPRGRNETPSVRRNLLAPHRRNFSLHSAASSLVDSAESLVLSLHSATGLPWLYTIPLAALLLRVTLTLPFSVYAHLRITKIMEIQPLLKAWDRTIMRRLAGQHRVTDMADIPPNTRELPDPSVGGRIVSFTQEGGKTKVTLSDGSGGGDGTEKERMTPQEWIRESRKEMRRKRKEVYKMIGAQSWKSMVGLVQVPIWIMASLAIWRISGRDMSTAWFGIAARQPTQPVDTIAGEGGEVVSGVAEGLQDAAGSATADITTAAGEGIEAISTATDAESLAILARTSMSLEGVPNWFPSLLEPDPLFIFPLIFSLAIFTNVELQTYRNPPQSRTTRVIRNAIRLVSLAIFPLTVNQPVLLHLYWCTSATYSIIQNSVLNAVWPMPEKLTKPEEVKTPLADWVQLPLREEDKEENFRVVGGRKVFTKRLHGLEVSDDDWMWDLGEEVKKVKEEMGMKERRKVEKKKGKS